MKERKRIIIKVFVPLFIICIVSSGIHYYQLVEKNIKKTIEEVDNTSHMYDFYSRINDQQIDLSSQEFDKEYERWSSSYQLGSYHFKGVLDDHKNVEKFNLIGYENVDFEMMIASTSDMYNLDLSLLDDIQLSQLIDILKVEYKNKIAVEVAGEHREAVDEERYIPDATIVKYLKVNDQVIVEGDDTIKIQGYFTSYQDEDNIIMCGYNPTDDVNYDQFANYFDLKKMRTTITTVIRNNEVVQDRVDRLSEEMDDDYYIYDYIDLYKTGSATMEKQLLSVTVLDNLKSNISQEVFNDQIFLYITMLGLMIVSLITLQYIHWKPTKKLLTTIHTIDEKNKQIDSLKGVNQYVEDLETRYHQEMAQMQNDYVNLKQQLETYQPVEVVMENQENELLDTIDKLIERYRLLLNNKKIRVERTVHISRVGNLNKYEATFSALFNLIAYQVQPNQTIEISVDQMETTMILSDKDIDLQNNEKLVAFFKKHQSTYKIDIIDDKKIVSFYHDTDL